MRFLTIMPLLMLALSGCLGEQDNAEQDTPPEKKDQTATAPETPPAEPEEADTPEEPNVPPETSTQPEETNTGTEYSPQKTDLTNEDVDRAIARIERLERSGEYAEAWRESAAAYKKFYTLYKRRQELRELKSRLQYLNSQVRNVQLAIDMVGSDDPQSIRQGLQQLRQAGAVGRALARGAVREADEKTALRCARLLAQMLDSEAAEAFVDRLRQGPGRALRRELVLGLKQVGSHPEPDLLKQVQAVIEKDATFHHLPLAGYLARAYHSFFEGDAAKYNAQAGPGAAKALKDYIERAMEHSNAEISAWGVQNAGYVGMRTAGLHGQYFAGEKFQKLVFERLDEQIHWPDGNFGYPDKRREDLSIRWTGSVHIPRDGKYTFYSTSDDGQRVWVNDKQVVDDWNYHGMEEESGTIELKAGMYPLKVEFFQGGGGAGMMLHWSGPGIKKELLGGTSVSTLPWPGMEE